MNPRRSYRAYTEMVRRFAGIPKDRQIIEMEPEGDGTYVPKTTDRGLRVLGDIGELYDAIKGATKWPPR